MFDLENIIDTSLDYVNELRGPLSAEELDYERKELIKLSANTKKYFLHIISNLSRVFLPALGKAPAGILPSLGKVNLSVDDNLDIDSLNVSGKPVVYISNHASNLDTLVIGLQLFRNNFPFPVIAAGDNLFVNNIVRSLLISGGAFELRRKFPKDGGIYVTRMNSYLRANLEGNVPIMFYPEGTRTREGGLKEFQRGLLSMILDSYLENLTSDSLKIDDVIFVPVGIRYTKVPEESYFLQNQDSKAQQTNLFLEFLKLGIKMEPVYLHIGEPISTKEYVLSRRNQLKVLRNVLASHYVQIDESVDTGRFLKSRKYQFLQLRSVLKAMYKRRSKPQNIKELIELFAFYVPSEKQRRYMISDVFANDLRERVAETVPVLEDHVREYAIVDLVEEEGSHIISMERLQENVTQLMHQMREKYGPNIISSKHTLERYIARKYRDGQLHRQEKQLIIKEIGRSHYYGNIIRSLLHIGTKDNS